MRLTFIEETLLFKGVAITSEKVELLLIDSVLSQCHVCHPCLKLMDLGNTNRQAKSPNVFAFPAFSRNGFHLLLDDVLERLNALHYSYSSCSKRKRGNKPPANIKHHHSMNEFRKQYQGFCFCLFYYNLQSLFLNLFLSNPSNLFPQIKKVLRQMMGRIEY